MPKPRNPKRPSVVPTVGALPTPRMPKPRGQKSSGTGPRRKITSSAMKPAALPGATTGIKRRKGT